MAKQKLYVSEVDCSTGIQTEREFTEEEYANYEKLLAEQAEQIKLREAEAQAKAEAQAAAIAKLETLGLTAEDIKTIVG